jgi:hypothetical protein
VGGSTLGIGLARGVKELDGEPLPPIQTPNIGFVFVEDYKSAKEGVLAAYLNALGDWPHHTVSVAGLLDYIGLIYVRPNDCDSDDIRDWSKIYFITQQGEAPEGARIDWAHADEPPAEKFWREARFRGKANAPLYLFITATPLYRSQWEWLKKDFPVRSDSPNADRVTVVGTVYDNKALSAKHIAGLELLVKGDPLEAARLRGDFVDVEGKSPFDYAALQRWMKRTADPAIRPDVLIEAEQEGEGGRFITKMQVRYDCWEMPSPDEEYFLICDPSLGIRDALHDPAAIHVYSRRNPRLVARYNDYLPGYALGNLAWILALKYNRALIDVDVTGGYGEPVLNALARVRYMNVNSDDYADRPGSLSSRLGFRINAANRSEMIGATQRALLEDSITVWSEDVVRCLMDVSIDPAGKVLAAPGKHDEDLICLGRAAHLLESRPAPRPRRKPQSSHLKEFMKKLGMNPSPAPAASTPEAW